MKPGIEKFIAVVLHCPDYDKVLEIIQSLRRTKEYKCSTASVFALHVILDLYSEDSSPEANIARMTVSLEAAAHELLFLSKRLMDIAQHPGQN